MERRKEEGENFWKGGTKPRPKKKNFKILEMGRREKKSRGKGNGIGGVFSSKKVEGPHPSGFNVGKKRNCSIRVGVLLRRERLREKKKRAPYLKDCKEEATFQKNHPRKVFSRKKVKLSGGGFGGVGGKRNHLRCKRGGYGFSEKGKKEEGLREIPSVGKDFKLGSPKRCPRGGEKKESMSPREKLLARTKGRSDGQKRFVGGKGQVSMAEKKKGGGGGPLNIKEKDLNPKVRKKGIFELRKTGRKKNSNARKGGKKIECDAGKDALFPGKVCLLRSQQRGKGKGGGIKK